MDRFEAMSLVLAVAEAGSLSAAARRQKTPLATVSRKVSELEAHLQTKLFNRSSRALVPTDAGRSYIAASKRILADVAEAERTASGEYTTPRGDLIVSSPFAFGRLHLVPVMAEFVAVFPEVDIQLDLQDRPVNLVEDHVDVALRIGILTDSSLIAIRIGEIRRVLCASPAYLKSRGTPKSPEDLSTHDCISFLPFHSSTTWTFKRDQTEYVVPVRSRLVLNNLEATCDAARAGMGIAAAFSYQLAESIKSGELVLLLQDFEPPPLPVSLVYPPNRFMPVKLRAFLDFALPRLRARIGDLPKRAVPRARAGSSPLE
ncbi:MULTISPECIES: LysR family transcriptional regulator [unclassified Bradyrhizobium]|uniref:LysR family transcriptional regulator n=1 Tax=unclassified Bradyrhizobium TaxID=2631580 RepID=UPI001BA8B24A|nr:MULTISPECIES: LysR family transcriptional regulator [unclassified Bradyrhizobium]MBR1227058.1 LysR family transcriptional regulator [Bradyrhizobium sp. AUGA SZCCT0176]MBR1287190.1 LysR family transcriptional regulator [Bradyrhizobium sp. AUGA SZCCT0177]MBR1296552.1 LysR family transcriptional regulator [Bradyrhizobium sp. AUGA SZCCT0042]